MICGRLSAPGAVHGFIGLALGFLLAFGFAAVVELFALGDRQFAFRNAVPEINLQRDDGEALLLRLDRSTGRFRGD